MYQGMHDRMLHYESCDSADFLGVPKKHSNMTIVESKTSVTSSRLGLIDLHQLIPLGSVMPRRSPRDSAGRGSVRGRNNRPP